MRVAIVGSGISGLTAARQLYRTHDVTVFEASSRIGGHTHTWDVELHGQQWRVDSGFIVYNDRNYPNFSHMLRELDVASQPTTMSFSVRHDGAGLEYNGSDMRRLFVQPRNIARPAFLRMIRDILRFNRDAVAYMNSVPGASVADMLADKRYSDGFRDWYLLPMASALWSIPRASVLTMPARYVISFFDNHSMLTTGVRPQWRVVTGGSATYIDAMTRHFADRIRTSAPVRRVMRSFGGVEVDGEPFDRVVFACHSDQALAILEDATDGEREILSALPYQANDAVLHTDTSVLPRARRAWGAWNYRVNEANALASTVTYNMNALQSLNAPETFCVTLNDRSSIDPRRIIGEVRYHHPVATLAGEVARARRSEISGSNRTHYCGAYWGNGFHEAGATSGLEVAAEVRRAMRTSGELALR